jgi:Amt family ammonium transporter
MNAGDSAWMLTSTALVLFMVPGLALFYGGLVGHKNVIAMMAESFVAIGIVTVVWAVVGYPSSSVKTMAV